MNAVIKGVPFLVDGIIVTLQVSALVVLFSLIAGVVLGLCLTFGKAWLRWPLRVLADVIRGIPILVLIFAIYYGLPALGINLNNFWAVVVALSVFKTAQVMEITRGAYQSIPLAQHEAGKAVGLTFLQRLIYVLTPQAVRRFLPPFINSTTDAVKGSALVSLFGVVDLMMAMQQVIGRTYEPMPLYLTGAAIYFVINYSLSQASRRLEQRYAYIRD